jgi:hypothetical protein
MRIDKETGGSGSSSPEPKKPEPESAELTDLKKRIGDIKHLLEANLVSSGAARDLEKSLKEYEDRAKFLELSPDESTKH